MSNTSGDVVFFVKYACVEFAKLAKDVWSGKQVLGEVASCVRPGPNANRIFGLTWNNARIFQSGPSKFEDNPLLRIHDFGVSWWDTEKARIEFVGAFYDPASRHVARGLCITRWQRGIEFLWPKASDRFTTMDQVVPVRLQVRSSRHFDGHADDCEAVGAVCSRATIAAGEFGSELLFLASKAQEAPDGRVVEELCGRNFDAKFFFCASNDLSGSNRVSAKLEVIV